MAGYRGLVDARLTALVAAWGLLVGAGLVSLWRYAATPGADGIWPARWPAQSAIARDGRATLLVFAHPSCPCTRASLSELARLMAVCSERVDAHALFIAPEGTGKAWLDTDLVAQARSIPGVRVHADPLRREAALFGAQTSGCCLLYGPAGELLFHGGLTASRGHEGDNLGRQSLEAILLGEGPHSEAGAVFGCPLFEPAADGAACSAAMGDA